MRYIDADYFKKRLMLWADNPEKGAMAKVFVELLCNVIDEVPTADVVPKSEVAREIFEEIEKFNRPPFPECQPVYIIKARELAELKKKYAEGKG